MLKVLIILDLANVKPYINKYKNIYNEKNKEKLKEYARIFFSEYGNVTQEEYYGNKQEAGRTRMKSLQKSL